MPPVAPIPPIALDASAGHLDFGPAGYLYATHPLHAFAARCPPPLASWAINTYSRPGETILDPMAGSGTALVEAALLGRRAQGVDIDPLARLIARAKATPVDVGAWSDAVEQVLRRAREPHADDGWRPDLPNLEKWFRDDVATALAALRTAIRGCSAGEDIRTLLWVCLSSLIVARTSVANARDLVHSRHHYREWTQDPGVIARFAAKTRQAARMMQDYRRRLDQAAVTPPQVTLVGDDAREISIPLASVDLVFTSPPYCSALDYTRAHIFAVAWLSDVLGTAVEEYRHLGRRYVGSERAPFDAVSGRRHPPPVGSPVVDEIIASLHADRRRAWIVNRYFRDMRLVIDECARVTRRGGHVVLVVCPSNIRAVPIPTHSILASMAAATGRLDLAVLHERTINDNRRVMPYIEAAFGSRMRTEYVLVLRRNDSDG